MPGVKPPEGVEEEPLGLLCAASRGVREGGRQEVGRK